MQEDSKCVSTIATGSRLTCIAALLPKTTPRAESKARQKKSLSKKRMSEPAEEEEALVETPEGVGAVGGSKRTVVKVLDAGDGTEKPVRKKRRKRKS